MNILTIRRFYGFISPLLRPVVEAGEDGGEYQLPNTTKLSSKRLAASLLGSHIGLCY